MRRSECYNIALVLFWLVLLVASSQGQSCGKRRVPNLLILGGTEAKEGLWPWYAVVFNGHLYRCGGSILDRDTILTTAECVTIGTITLEKTVVYVGRARISLANQRTQKYTANEIIIHPGYNKTSFAHNIALIKLSEDITYTDYVQPVCLWNRVEDQHSIVGSMGTVIGFGYDESDSNPDTLREVRIPIVDHLTCAKSNWLVYGKYLTVEMLCAGNGNGIGACYGDAGGGFFFSYNNVWYIRGIVSFVQLREGSKVCDPNGYTVLTDVAKYFSWIATYLQQKRSFVPTSLVPQALSCGKRKVFANVNSPEGRNGYWPWHAALLKKRHRSFEYACGGTILTQNTILTAAHCVMTSHGPIALHLMIVQVGRSQLYVESQYAQDHDVNELIIHPEFIVNRFAYDIALVMLVTDISFNDYIQPICLWNRDDDVHSILGYRATVIGFSNDDDEESPDILKEESISVVDSILCKPSDLATFSIEEKSKMFCAGNRQGKNNCNDETGGGLFFNNDDVWYIRGLMSFPKLRSYVCDPKGYTLVTDVAKYLSWIAKYLPPKSDVSLSLQYRKPAPKRCRLRC